MVFITRTFLYALKFVDSIIIMHGHNQKEFRVYVNPSCMFDIDIIYIHV